jgi:hypothetical protein
LKKYLPYLLGVLLFGGIIALIVTGDNSKQRKLDERVTLRRHDKIPYGAYVAYKSLEELFPAAHVFPSNDEPGYWDSLSVDDDKQALIIIANKLNADETEMKKLIGFVEKGNDVFVSVRTISYMAGKMLDCDVTTTAISSYYENNIVPDSLQLVLNDPPFTVKAPYVYPGKKLDAVFSKYDPATTEVLGKAANGQPNFIRLRAGKGNLYVHLAPLAFTNYFLLHKANIDYYEKVFSVIDPQTTRIGWDEYYTSKRFSDEPREKKKSWLTVLSRYPALKAALLTAIFTLLLYVLLEMRRKQRHIPVVTRPRNDSMDFVKTIGRLYFDKGDHRNLARKMSSYFLEHVRSKYKLATGTLDEEFILKLQHKSGVDEAEIRGIVTFIKYVEDAPAINHKQLADLHKQLEAFYKKA